MAGRVRGATPFGSGTSGGGGGVSNLQEAYEGGETIAVSADNGMVFSAADDTTVLTLSSDGTTIVVESTSGFLHASEVRGGFRVANKNTPTTKYSQQTDQLLIVVGTDYHILGAQGGADEVGFDVTVEAGQGYGGSDPEDDPSLDGGNLVLLAGAAGTGLAGTADNGEIHIGLTQTDAIESGAAGVLWTHHGSFAVDQNTDLGGTTTTEDLHVTGTSTFDDDIEIDGALTVDDLIASTVATGTLSASGLITASADITIDSALSPKLTITSGGAATIYTNLGIAAQHTAGYSISVATPAGAGDAGGGVSATSGRGANGSGGIAGGPAGLLLLQGGQGGTGTATALGGDGGNVRITGGQAGSSGGAGAGATGQVQIQTLSTSGAIVSGYSTTPANTPWSHFGDFAINTNKFTVAAASGNTVVAGTLGVTGATTLAALTMVGAFSQSTGAFAVSTGSGDISLTSGSGRISWTEQGSTRIAPSGTTQTTNATQTTAATIGTASDTSYMVRVMVTGCKSDGTDAASFLLTRGFVNDSGTLTALGAAVGVDPYKSAGATTWDATMDISGTSIRVRVTGAASTTINWRVRGEIVNS